MQVALGTSNATSPGWLELPRPASRATSLERSICVISPGPPPLGGPCHLTRLQGLSPPGHGNHIPRPPGPPYRQSPLGDLCHLTESPASFPRVTRAASPGLQVPRRSRRPGASRLRASPRLHAQPAWLVEFGGRQRPNTSSA